MTELKPLSKQTRHNWEIDALLFISAVIAVISGIYFLLFPGGYQGGRNPFYNTVILFGRYEWDLIHTWTGAAMIAAAAIHIAIHWKWIASMTRRTLQSLFGRIPGMNRMARFNVAINALTGLSFIVAAITSVYFLYFPGGRGGTLDPMILFSRTVWDLLHTWSGIVFTATAVIHFAIHWKWVTKVTRRYFLREKSQDAAIPAAGSQQPAASAQ